MPVAVVQRPAQGGFDFGAVEGGQGDDGPAADGGAVAGCGGEHGLEAPRVADGAEGGDGRLSTQGVVVLTSDGDERIDGGLGRRPPFAECPGGGLHHGAVRIGERRNEVDLGEGDRLFACTATNAGVGVGQRPFDVRGEERPRPGERAQRRRPHRRIGVVQEGASRRLVTFVPSNGCLAATIHVVHLAPSHPTGSSRGGARPMHWGMAHMVIFRRPDGKPGYHQADGVDDAIRFVEMLRNQEKVTDARIFRMEEVPIEIRTYYKVEVASEAAAEEPAPVASSATPSEPLAPVPPSVANALPDTPPDVAPLDPLPVEVGAGKGRRFGGRI